MMDFVESRCRESARATWKAKMIDLAKKEDYAGVLRLMAKNVGDKGNILSLIDGFCANADPQEGAV